MFAVYSLLRDGYLTRLTEPSPKPATIHHDTATKRPQWGALDDALRAVDRETAEGLQDLLPPFEWLWTVLVEVE